MKANRMFLVALLLLVIIGNLSAMGFSQAETDLSQGLVAYWKFDEGEGDIVFDETENNNDGTIHGASWAAGKVGSALEFDGVVDDFVEVPDSDSLDISDKITLAAWIKINNINEWAGIASKGDAYHLRFGGSDDIYLHILVNGEQRWGGSFFVSDCVGKWIHVAALYDYQNERIETYLNGEIMQGGIQGGNFGPVDLSENSLTIGRLGGSCFDGAIDEVRIYNRALTEDEIKEICQQGQGNE